MYRAAIKWSPIEITYLKENRDVLPINQLTIALAKSRAAIQRKYDELDGKPVPKKKGGTKIGTRKDLGLFLRSGWEANCLRWYKSRRIKWEYEPKVFFFEGVKHGTVSYTPDFWLSGKKIWIEVKGQCKPKDKTKIRRFKKHYPEEFAKLRAIVGRPGTKADLFFKSMGVPIEAYYNELDKKYAKTIKHWE